MSTPIISIKELSKCYRLGLKEQKEDVLIHSLFSFLKAPIKSYKYLKSLSHFEEGIISESDPSILWALKDVSFDLEEGQAVGIIGFNGAGKSTLLKVLSRVTQPTKGSVHVHGRVASLLEVGTGFHPDLTGRENVYLNGTILGMTKKEIDRKFDEIVDFAEIEAFIDTPIKRYSSGMAVRLAFAVAAHLEPEILVIDEVLAVGDISFQRKCLGKMKDVSQKKGRTVLFVSHNMGAIRTLCDKAVLLNRGSVAQIGSTEKVIAHYLSSIDVGADTCIALPKAEKGSPIQGIALEFSDKAGNPKIDFKIAEPWRVTFSFEVTQDLGEVVAGIGISTTESVQVITYWSNSSRLRKGKYQVTFDINIPLAAGDFNFAVGIDNAGQTIYFKNNLGHVSILDVAMDVQPVCSRGTGILASFERPSIEAL